LGRFVLSALLWGWVGLVGTVTGVVGLVLFPVFNPWTDPRRRVMDYLNHLWATVTLWGLPTIHVHVYGAEKLRTGETFLICANHQSVADIVGMLCAVRAGKLISKRALFWSFPLGIGMRLSGYIRASPQEEGSKDRVLEEGRAWLERGCHVVAFPEGTRSPDGKLLRFRKGPFLLAQSANVRVMPVAIRDTRTILPKGSFFYGLHSVGTVEVLEPMSVVGDPREFARQVRDRIAEAMSRAPLGERS
jgi:1-acyl-sn-glycerol-3-phosphate acyltransferase